MIYYKINILEELKAKGYNSAKIRKENIFGQETLKKIRRNEPPQISLASLDKICTVLDCQPGDILGYRKDETKAE